MLRTLFIEYQLLTTITLFAVQLALALIMCTAKKTKTEDQRSKEPLAHEGRPSTVSPKMPPKKTSQRRKKMTDKELEGIAKKSTEMTKENVTQKMEKEGTTTATIVTSTKPRMKTKKKEKETKAEEGSYEEQMGDVQLIRKTDNEWEKERREVLKKSLPFASEDLNVDHGQSPDDTLKNVSSMQDEQQGTRDTKNTAVEEDKLPTSIDFSRKLSRTQSIDIHRTMLSQASNRRTRKQKRGRGATYGTCMKTQGSEGRGWTRDTTVRDDINQNNEDFADDWALHPPVRNKSETEIDTETDDGSRGKEKKLTRTMSHTK